MNHEAKRTQGFTMVELLLAMGFISALLLAIAMTIIQIGTTYNKGMLSKELNQISRTVSEELTRNVSAVESFSLTDNYRADRAGGRLCLGTYSYIWNNARAVSEGTIATPYIPGSKNPNNTPKETIRLVKIEDPSRLYCAKNGAGLFSQQTILATDTNRTQELIAAGDRALGLYNLTVTSAPSARDAASGQQLYTINYTIGTLDVKAINLANTGCKQPGEQDADVQYCTLQQFTIVLRTGNRVN